ncbi:hypothetical protein Acsp03_33890 [Actinomadura sp. NBRC 104412]|uniref:hypothetical protein n=1 Tax=Actinomadura sp. NBRC 104412 TaxID=3032203 RepID=UPI0024A0B0AE|nr:hypothetical protein [Actinomadura sp. NBRC 104412]GLZ05923.1 hypothetical protein Acsp03_33890 [Actinomadura sp. NBRC 104412]
MPARPSRPRRRPGPGPRVTPALLALPAVSALLAGSVLIAAPQPASAAHASGRGSRDDAKVAFTVADPRINESSGLAVSRRHPGIVYTQNDSGGVAQIFALGPDGRTRAVLSLAGARARDWEAMAMGRDERGRPAIFVADIGDNLGGAWPYVTVYRVTEPASLRTRTVRATAFRFTYEDGPRNAEAMMIDPRTNRLYIASKLFTGALYRAPAKLSTERANTLRKVGDAPTLATDAAFAPDGRTFVIRNYFGARIYRMGADGRPGRSLTSVGIPAQEQGESIAYTADGRWLLAGSEGVSQPVYRVPVPEEARPSPSATSSASPQARRDATEGRRDSTGASVGLFLALGATAALGYALLRRRS